MSTAGPGSDGSAPPPVPGEGWERGPDGMPTRRAARVLLFDPDGRVLLARGHDAHQVERTWWFTVGGGIDPGEDARTAAVRELREETGLALDPSRLHGPVARRTAVFDFFARTVRQHETFFAAYLDQAVAQEDLDDSAWTDVERAFMDELAWHRAEDLHRCAIELFPAELPELVGWLRGGWDGVERSLGDQLPH